MRELRTNGFYVHPVIVENPETVFGNRGESDVQRHNSDHRAFACDELHDTVQPTDHDPAWTDPRIQDWLPKNDVQCLFRIVENTGTLHPGSNAGLDIVRRTMQGPPHCAGPTGHSRGLQQSRNHRGLNSPELACTPLQIAENRLFGSGFQRVDDASSHSGFPVSCA